MLFIGDVHGRVREYNEIVQNEEHTAQLGDFGFGFFDHNKIVPKLGGNRRFVRGNHDSPAICRGTAGYLGDYGFAEKPSIFFVSGAWSIDWKSRIPGISIWDDEELTYETLGKALDKYSKVKPRIMISHEGPSHIVSVMMGKPRMIKTRTSEALQAMFEVHKPEYWFFGHHHNLQTYHIGVCQFVCLGELDVYRLAGVEW
jgi:predicted phosphohydrolase